MNGDVLMIRVEKNNRNSISPLFQGIDDSMVIAYLQGFMGVAYADRLPNPRFTVIISGEYCFFGGTPDSKDAKELVECIFDLIEGDSCVAIYAADNLGWRE